MRRGNRSELETFLDCCCSGDYEGWYWVNDTTVSISAGNDFDLDESNTDIKTLCDLPVQFRRAGGKFSIGRAESITSLERCPQHVDGDFICNRTGITTLRDMPKFIGHDFFTVNCPNLSTWEMRYALLAVIKGTIFADISSYPNDEVGKILQSGRVDGVMPSDLIPGKIKQLKDLS